MDAQKKQQKSQSEVAQFLEQWDQEMEAIQQGLQGLAITARHEFINRRMQAVGEQKLIESMTLETQEAAQDTGTHKPK